MEIEDNRPLLSNKFDIPEFLPGQEQIEEEQSQKEQSLDQRIISKIWKVRQEAIQEITNLFENQKDNPTIFEEYSSKLENFIGDQNLQVQEKGLIATQTYIENTVMIQFDQVSFVQILISKPYGVVKTKQKSYDILQQLFQLGSQQDVINGILQSIQSKNQKTSSTAIQSLCEIIENFGIMVMKNQTKQIFQEIEKTLLSSSNLIIQKSCMRFYQEAFKWMRESIRPYLVKLKNIQVEELEKYYKDNIQDKPQAVPNKNIIKNGQEIKSEVSMNQKDLYDESDAVDIFIKYNENWSEKVLNKEKWSDKKEALDDFLKDLIPIIKLAPSNFNQVCSMLKRILKDPNVNVVISGVKILGLLSKGLRKNFTGQAKQFFSILIQKFKEKKITLTEELHKTLKYFYFSLQLEDVQEDIKEIFQDKNQIIKVNFFK